MWGERTADIALARCSSTEDAVALAAALAGLSLFPGEAGKKESIDSIQAQSLGPHGTEASGQTHCFKGRSWIHCAWGKRGQCTMEGISYLSVCKKHSFSTGKIRPGAREEITLITTHLLLSGILICALLRHGASPAAAG